MKKQEAKHTICVLMNAQRSGTEAGELKLKKLLTKKQLWKIYNDSPGHETYWEHWDDSKEWLKGSGLLLAICPHCGEKQTRENYLSTSPKPFWLQWITLIQDLHITGIAQHQCGKWVQVDG